MSGTVQGKGSSEARIRYLECMDQINRAIHRSDDAEEMLRGVLKEAFPMFGCDRIWLFHPCDPEAPTYRIPVEIARSEYPGAHSLSLEVPMKPMGDRFCAKALATSGPVVYRSDTDPPIFKELTEQFGVRSQIAMAIYPRVGKPWMIGMHQCSHERIWSEEDQRLFEGIALRIGEALSTLLLLRDLEAIVEERTAELRHSNEQLARANRELEGAQRLLRQSEERLRLFIEHAPAALAMFDREMRYISVSRRWRSDYSLEAEELRGRSHYEVFPELPSHWKETHQRALAGETVKADEDLFVRPDGSLQWLRWEVLPWRDGSGAIGGILILTEDITELKEAERALRDREMQLNILFERSPLGIVLVDPENFRFVKFNEKAHLTLGYDREEFGRLSVFDIDATFDPSEIRKKGEDFRNEGWHQFETRGRTKTGDLLEFQLTGQMVQIGGKPYMLQIFEDITARKAVEGELIQAKEAADEANRAKSEFLAVMSHEIRTPLSVVIASIDHLLQTTTDPQKKMILEMADSSADRLNSLIEDILDFSRIEARRVDIRREPFDLRECIAKAAEIFRMQAETAGLYLRCEFAPQTPDILQGDADRLAQVLINLIGNALKFTEHGGITVRTDARPDGVVISVRDTGIGVAQGKLDRLFKSFSQVDSSLTRKYGGTGLGLAISKSLVELMGGTIWVESEEGRGSVFSFTLPAWSRRRSDRREGAEEGVQVPAAEPSPPPGKILLVDDDPLVRSIMEAMLLDRGWEVVAVPGGRQALQMFQEGNFDLVLMDLQMPGMSGLETTRKIRELEPADGKRTPIIALTAHVRPEDRKSSYDAGMDDFLPKPVSSSVLYATIEKSLKKSPP